MTIQELARQGYNSMETRTRDNGETYVCRKEDAPAWLDDLIREAHGDMLPDDWTFSTVRDALSYITEHGEDADPHLFADDSVDVYTADRIAWLGSHSCRPSYCDQARDEFGAGNGILDQIGAGQYLEALEVFGGVLNSLERSRAVV